MAALKDKRLLRGLWTKKKGGGKIPPPSFLMSNYN